MSENYSERLGPGGGGVQSSTLSIRLCAAKKTPPFGGFLSHKGYAFSGISSHKGYTLSAFSLTKGVFFSEICSKAAFVNEIFKEKLCRNVLNNEAADTTFGPECSPRLNRVYAL